MPAIIWGVTIIGGLFMADKVVNDSGSAAQKSADLTRWVVIGGALYVFYRASKK